MEGRGNGTLEWLRGSLWLALPASGLRAVRVWVGVIEGGASARWPRHAGQLRSLIC